MTHMYMYKNMYVVHEENPVCRQVSIFLALLSTKNGSRTCENAPDEHCEVWRFNLILRSLFVCCRYDLCVWFCGNQV